MGMGPRVLASASSQMQASISVIKKGAAPFPSQEPVLTSTNAPGYPKKSEEPFFIAFNSRTGMYFTSIQDKKPLRKIGRPSEKSLPYH